MGADHDHWLVVHPIKRDRLSCIFCPHDESLPVVGSSREFGERLDDLHRAHGRRLGYGAAA
jgi:hypothetical protein